VNLVKWQPPAGFVTVCANAAVAESKPTSNGAEGQMSGKSRRGFASMDPARQREIASKGGRAAHEKGTAHEWSSDEARQAGRKGGVTVSRDRAHMAAIGREGGESRGAAARQARQGGGGEWEVPMAVTREDGGRGTPPERFRPDLPRLDRPRLDETSPR
jgi:general stress protein YciG